MYQLQIVGPRGRRTLQWDPQKLKAHDPVTVATVREADRLLREVAAQRRQQSQTGDVPLMAASVRWLT